MSVLGAMKLVAAKQERQTDPVQLRRTKLMAALNEQIALAKADRKSTRLNSSHIPLSRMPSSA